MSIWNPWHGCIKYSAGCQNCYVYRRDESVGRDASIISKTGNFDLPLKKNRNGEYKIPPGSRVFACMTSDFFIEQADEWRPECWDMIRKRKDVHFAITTKRIDRFLQCIPDDWGEGYTNVSIHCTCENQEAADKRIPILLALPIVHRHVGHEPMLGPIDIERYLDSGLIESVLCGGESGPNARECNYDWVLSSRMQCIRKRVPFHFKQTGANFIKDSKAYRIRRELQMPQAAKADIDFNGDFESLIAKSDFRSRFNLDAKDIEYIDSNGLDAIREHASDFISKRLAPAEISNDGKQTPMRGHPVFKAQHACACCCRGCFEKWHGIERGRDLTESEIDYAVATIMDWICNRYSNASDNV